MRLSLQLSGVLAVLVAGGASSGCSRQAAAELSAQSAQGTAAPTSTPAPIVPHPEFINWQQFPIGTEVTRVRRVSNAASTITVTTRTRLADKNQRKITLETQTDVQRPNEPLEQNAPTTLDVSASFALPSGMQAEQFSMPALKARKAGQEPIDVLGKEYVAQIYGWEDSSEAGPISVQVWWCDDLPGRVVQEKTKNAGTGVTSIEVVAGLKIPGSPELPRDSR